MEDAAVWLPPITFVMLWLRKSQLSRRMPCANVVHSTEMSGMSATTNARMMSARITMSLRLRAAVYERVGLNLSKSITGAASACGVDCGSLIICSLSR